MASGALKEGLITFMYLSGTQGRRMNISNFLSEALMANIKTKKVHRISLRVRRKAQISYT